MAELPYHPAPGLGDMMPGWWDVPQNPITAARGITKVPGIGEIIDGYFVVPQNPIRDFVKGQVRPLGQGAGRGSVNGPAGAGCSCGGSCGCGGGMGDISTDFASMTSNLGQGNFAQAGTDFLTLLQEPTLAGIPLWAFGIGVFFLIQMVTSHEVAVQPRARRSRA